MKFQLRHLLGVILGIIVMIVDFILFYNPLTRWFQPLIVIGLLLLVSPYILDFFKENKRQKEIELKFLEFVRNIVGTVKAGVPIPKAILQVSKENYGALTPYVKKLARHIEWGIPTHTALITFSNDTNNKVIKRSIAIVIESEKSGGNMEDVLQAVSNSVVEIKKIKEERRASVYNQIVQGYLVFFVFIIIMMVLQVKLLPPLQNISNLTLVGFGETFKGVSGQAGTLKSLDNTFLALILIQGFFVGIMIGKFSEGNLKFGLKHSLILMVIGYLIISTVRGV